MAKRKAAALSCSFCGKSKEHFKMLISGLAASICNECIDLCYKVISDHRQRQAVELTANKNADEGKKKKRKKITKK
jgi:ATP-dependent Clp protease ATP-binding subunit ClpX